MRTEAGDRPLDVLVPAFADPVDARIHVGLVLEDGGNVTRAPTDDGLGSLALRGLEPVAVRLVDDGPARLDDPIAQGVGLREIPGLARGGTLLGESNDVLGCVRHPRAF